MASAPKTIIKKVTAVLHWDGGGGERLDKAKHILESLRNNRAFPLPWPTNIISFAQLEADITALDAARRAAETRAKGTADAEHAAFARVHNDLESIMTMVQNRADLDPATAETLIAGAGYAVAKRAGRGPRQTGAKPGKTQGSVILAAEGKGPHQWQQSPDGGATIIELGPTTSGKRTVTDLQSAKKLWFRSRQVLKKGAYGPWSEWMSVVVP